MSYSEDIAHAALAPLPWEQLEGRSVLVVGATGLIGGCLVDVLMARRPLNFHVFAAGRNETAARQRFAPYLDNGRFSFIRLDVTSEIRLDTQFDYIVDAASGASPQLYSTDPVGIMRANFCGVDNLLSYGERHGMRRFVYVSSGEIYGEGDGRKFTEDYLGYIDGTSVRACYPSSKRAAETLCVCHAAQYGVSVSIARPCHVYGPHFSAADRRVYAQFIRNVVRGEDIVMKSTGEQFRSWCYVVDCCEALLYILLKGSDGEAYNIADDTSDITIRQLADMVAAMGDRRVVMEVPEETERKGYSVIRKAVFDTSKIESLGWRIRGRMEEKMRSTIEEARQREV